MGIQLIRHKTCCFTGHRSLDGADLEFLGEAVFDEVSLLYRFGFDTFLAADFGESSDWTCISSPDC